MRMQWNLIFGLFFALIVALFAVFNVDSVRVNYLFGYAEIPLILIIFGSALLGGLVVGMFGIFRQYTLQRKIKRLEKELEQVKTKEDDVTTKDVDSESTSIKYNSTNES